MYSDECSVDRRLPGVAGAPRVRVQHATGRGFRSRSWDEKGTEDRGRGSGKRSAGGRGLVSRRSVCSR